LKTGVLLLNLGTPDRCDEKSVRRYLGEFLMDPHVIDIPWIARFLLVNGIILRTRPKKSTEAYAKVWTERGSPLLFHTIDLAEKVQNLLGEACVVLPTMRYGNPGVRAALEEFRRLGIEQVVTVPLYPQFARATTHSSVEWVKAEARKIDFKGELRFVPAFYRNEAFLEAFAEQLRRERARGESDFVLFSFHGLPERQVLREDKTGAHCLKEKDCCERIVEANAHCYRAQCFYTARRIAELAGLDREHYTIAFQSRLGRARWIAPYADVTIRELAMHGRSKRLLVVSPSFVADCLETIEELGIRACEDFIACGGEELRLVPSLNSSDAWAECVGDLVRSELVLL
jgi:ferrochelatase